MQLIEGIGGGPLNNQNFLLAMEDIIQVMQEKGYDPILQLRGYVLENEPGYITRHKNARTQIQELDIGKVKKYIEGIKDETFI